jgi:hypothetical protein
MEKHGGKKKERHRAGVLDENVDPPVRRRPQTADEEQEEKDAEQKKDAGRGIVRAVTKNEETDKEEEKPEDGRIEIGLPSQPLGGEPDR